ncbi:RNA exonuclease 1 homolog [Onthophagus taurus]|uniref:RNA exonuclease 1 homolog n=1 Tax=Onthophagus taurus TaxID=166361 RepID=UPI000C204BE0|nr:RNA exonuclease 1 homolog [Onthophagus taurus]
MLPTTGFFKDIDCPFYENTCGRPYCHFRHRKKNQECSEDSQDSTEQSQDVPTYNPTPKSQLQNVRSHIPISYVPDIVVRTERSFRNPPTYTFNNVTYKPTPISELSKNKSNNESGEEQSQLNNTESDVNGIDFGEDIDLTSECALIDDIINDKNDENVNKVEEKKAPDKNDIKSTKEKRKKDEKSKSSKSSSKSSEKSSKSEKSRSKTDSHGSSSSGKHKDKKSSESSDSKRSSKSSSKHKDSKDHHKDKHKDHNENRHKSKHKEKSKDHDRDKSRHKSKISKDKVKSRSKEKHREKKKSESENEEKIITFKEEEINYNDLDDFLDDDDDDLENPTLEEECYRIFNEYKPEPIKLDPSNELQMQQEYIPTPKKRIAHQGADNIIPKITHEPPKPSQNPALTMMNRLKAARQAHANNEQKNIISEVNTMKRSNSSEVEPNKSSKIQKTTKEIIKEQPKKNTSLIDDIINGTSSTSTHVPKACDTLLKPKLKKIAPVQNVYSMQQAKAKIAEIANRNSNSKATPMQTIGKGSKRVAHVPDMSMSDIPDVLQSESKKIPINIRTRYLTLLADECLKLYLLKQDAYTRALNEEVKVTERCSAIVTYRNSAMLSVNRIRKELQEREAKGLGPISPDDTDPSEENSPFKGKKFYQNVSGYLLTEDDLDIHGYPREGPVPGRAIIKAQKSVPKVNLNPNQRLCCRCFKVYMVDQKGFSLYEEECQYHPLKKRTIRGDRIYLCCKSTEETGCATASCHVCETEAELDGYQTTMAPSSENDPRCSAVYALDCEMCYTTKGLELTRVTIVDSDSKTVYESLVKPLHPIVDYNTQFSGITKDQMDRTSTSILQVQANILHLCNSKTILIGHSLESDMKALKIVHSSIIDTSVLFPHRLGLPHKKALRVLASEYLKKIIQNDIGGHDSAEDAITCMELVIWKLKEDLKVRNVKT